jgi:hypothetical protein
MTNYSQKDQSLQASAHCRQQIVPDNLTRWGEKITVGILSAATLRHIKCPGFLEANCRHQHIVVNKLYQTILLDGEKKLPLASWAQSHSGILNVLDFWKQTEYHYISEHWAKEGRTHKVTITKPANVKQARDWGVLSTQHNRSEDKLQAMGNGNFCNE